MTRVAVRVKVRVITADNLNKCLRTCRLGHGILPCLPREGRTRELRSQTKPLPDGDANMPSMPREIGARQNGYQMLGLLPSLRPMQVRDLRKIKLYTVRYTRMLAHVGWAGAMRLLQFQGNEE